MDITELRIGNSVYDTEGKVNTVCVETFVRFNYQIKPIPLTEEWLIEFGFDQEFDSSPYYSYAIAFSDGYGRIVTLRLMELDGGFNDVILDRNNDGKRETTFLCHIKYVHQLQNFYSILTGGEELETEKIKT